MAGGDCDCLVEASERGSEGGVARARSLSPRQLAYYDVALHEAAAALLLPFPVRRRTRERQLPPIRPVLFPPLRSALALLLLGSVSLSIHSHAARDTRCVALAQCKSRAVSHFPYCFPLSLV